MSGTAGATAMLASTPTGPSEPAIITTSGMVTIWAATATARSSASTRGHPRSHNQVRIGGASAMRPAVAATDNAKPGSTAIAGQMIRTPRTATARAGTAAVRRSATSAIRPTSPINAARTTLGDGRTTTTKQPSTTIVRSAAGVRGVPQTRNTSSTAPAMIAKFAPDTARRCVSPAVRNSSTTSSGRPSVSPTTRPGSSPDSAAGSCRRASSANRVRTAVAQIWWRGGGATARGGVVVRNAAAVRSDR